MSLLVVHALILVMTNCSQCQLFQISFFSPRPHWMSCSCSVFPFSQRATDARLARHWTSLVRVICSPRWLASKSLGDWEDGEGSGVVSVLRPKPEPR